MKTRNSILLAFLLIMNGILLAQETHSFFINIPDKNYIPVVTHTHDGIRKAYSNIRNSKLDRLLNSYEVYSSKKVFESSKKPSLQNIYLIECNDLQLMNELNEKFKQFYPRIEKANGKPLFTPNDYGSTGGYTGPGSSQEDLDFIRAQEAWDITTGSSDIKIGISDTQFAINHEDLANKINVVVNANQNTNPYSSHPAPHGTQVSSLAGADTNNGKGMASIGYDSFIYAGVGLNASVLDKLSLFPEVKMLNVSWYSHTTPNGTPSSSYNSEKTAIDEIINDRKVVVVVAGGNGETTGTHDPNEYYFPASYKDVISVSSIGHRDFLCTEIWFFQTFLNHHEFYGGGPGSVLSHQHNDSIDIVAPGYGVHTAKPTPDNVSYNWTMLGTSFAAPMAAGTVALMFDVNYCIDPKEVETILKLTAVKIDTLPQNIQYYGKLGAGKLDAYEAVKMTEDMSLPFGTVEVKDRILYRPWFYKLETAPYAIKMTNNDVTGGSKLKFKARNNIEILSGNYYPSAGGYIDLSIDENLALDCPLPPTTTSRFSNSKAEKYNSSNVFFEVYPTLVNQDITILNKGGNTEKISTIKVFSIFGMEVFIEEKIDVDMISLNLGKLNEGLYILKVNGVCNRDP